MSEIRACEIMEDLICLHDEENTVSPVCVLKFLLYSLDVLLINGSSCTQMHPRYRCAH